MARQATCHIVSAGFGDCLEIDVRAGDCLIAADGGYRYCRQAGLMPDLLIGDFDSLGARAAADAHAAERITLPVAKDDTDTMAAVREGLARGFARFEIHAALGGDFGHELANLQTLLFIREHGAWGCLHGCGQDVYVVTPQDGMCSLPTGADRRVSVFSIAGDACGVCERGLAWELEDAILEAGMPLGVSNRSVGDRVQIAVAQGALAVVVGEQGAS